MPKQIDEIKKIRIFANQNSIQTKEKNLYG